MNSPSIPKAEPTLDSIEAAKDAFRETEASEFTAARAKYLEKIMPEAYAAVKNASRPSLWSNH